MQKRTYYNIHTHQPSEKEGEWHLLNLPDHFERAEKHICSTGIHPWYPESANKAELEKWAAHPHTKAIGECGLDKLCNTDFTLQKDLFHWQIQLAQKLNKPLIIHCVRAYSEALQLLKGAGVPVIFHGFNKHGQLAEEILRQGHYLSFGTTLMQKNPPLQEVIQTVPIDRFFLETDNNGSISIRDIYKATASLRGCTENELLDRIAMNFNAIFAA